VEAPDGDEVGWGREEGGWAVGTGGGDEVAAATDEEVGKKMGDGEVDEGIGEGGDSGM